MGSAKGLDKFLMSRALYLNVPKGSKPMTSEQINKAFAKRRLDIANARKNRVTVEDEPLPPTE